MGNQQSQFEAEFYSRYSYIQILEDPNFGFVKIYRKNTFRYDYVMILDIFFHESNQLQIDVFFSRLEKVKALQNQSCMKIFHHKITKQNVVSCNTNKIIIYAQYLNRNLHDYLCALRSNSLFSLHLEEIIYLFKQTAKSAILLKRMGISKFNINSKFIFLSMDGEVVLCPLVYLLESLMGSISQQKLSSLEKNYQKYSVTHLVQENVMVFPERKYLKALLLQMTGNLRPDIVRESNFLYQIIQQSQSFQHFYQMLPQTPCENLHIEQMYKGENFTGQFYNTD